MRYLNIEKNKKTYLEIDLFGTAKSFRTAIEETIRKDKIYYYNLRFFPQGCCTYVSDLLQRYLVEKFEFYTWLMSGEFEKENDFESHAWLETPDHNTVIDISGDQYRNNKYLSFDQPVYVGTRIDGFHDKFVLREPIAFTKANDPLWIDRKKESQYQAIVKRIR